MAASDQRQVRGQAMRESQARHRQMLRRAPSIACELTADGTILFVNEAFCKSTGYRPEELHGRNFWSVLCPGELQFQATVLRQRLETRDVSDYELKVRGRDGAARTMVWSFSKDGAEAALERLIGFGLDLTDYKRMDEELRDSVATLRRALEGTIEAFAMTVEVRDPYTAGHQRRVATVACAIGEEIGLGQEQLRALRLAGTIHDIGKISVPVEVLTKRGPITAEEMSILKAHPEVGYAILRMVEFPWPIAEIVHQHHERMDGSGYPLGLSGDQIRLEARIMAVADVVESMAGPRPYREALGIDKALEEISGKEHAALYDKEVVAACLKVVRENEFLWE